MSEQARIETAIDTTIDNCEVLRARLAKYEDADGKPITTIAEQVREIERQTMNCLNLRQQLEDLKAQPSGVVLPEPDIQTGRGYPDYSVELVTELLARLNSSTDSAGERCMCGGSPHTGQCLYEHFLSYSGLTDQPLLRYAYFHGAGFAAEIDQPSACGVDERAAFEAWYLGHFYMGDKHCGLEWLSTEPCGGYRHQHPAEQWIVWQARAALSAPSHGEQGPEGLGITQEQIDRHTTTAWECPPQSLVVLVSSLRRLASKNAAPTAGSQEQG